MHRRILENRTCNHRHLRAIQCVKDGCFELLGFVLAHLTTQCPVTGTPATAAPGGMVRVVSGAALLAVGGATAAQMAAAIAEPVCTAALPVLKIAAMAAASGMNEQIFTASACALAMSCVRSTEPHIAPVNNHADATVVKRIFFMDISYQLPSA